MDILQSVFSNVWSVFLVVVFFGGSIFVHELGHFLAARWRGVRVERFSIGFGPKIFGWRGKDGVEYRLSWLPLGGYVALPQLADMAGIEGESSADLDKLPPISYTSRIIVFVAGAVFNVLFAAALACLLYVVGLKVAEEEQTTVIGAVLPMIDLPSGGTAPGPAYAARIQPKDVVRAVDGRKVSTFSEIDHLVAIGTGRGPQNQPKVTLTIEREGQMLDVELFPQKIGVEEVRAIGIEPTTKVMISEIIKDSAAAASGLKPGDQITAIDDRAVSYMGAISEHLRQRPGAPVTLAVLRDGKPLTFTATPRKVSETAYRLGVGLRASPTEKTIHPLPWTLLKKDLVMIGRNLHSLLSPRSDVGFNKMQGVVGMAHQIYRFSKFDFGAVLWLVILINLSLAIFNLLPIPVLDGGHIVFATITKLRGRSLPGDLVAGTQSIFVVLLFSALIYLGIRDVRRIWRDTRAERTEQAAPPPAQPPAPLPPQSAPAAPGK